MIKKLKINETLLELIIGILISGILVQLIELAVAAAYPSLAGSKGAFAVGLWLGIVTAAGLAVHMYRSIDRALDMRSDDAEKYMRKAYLVRTVIILAVAAAAHFLDLGYVMSAFVGMLCLKFGAFLQPLVHRILRKKLPEGK